MMARLALATPAPIAIARVGFVLNCVDVGSERVVAMGEGLKLAVLI